MDRKISVIVPCYNQGSFLEECLSSIKNQTYSNWEALIVNDGSTDNTEQVAKKWVEKDSRFVYFYKTNGGLSSARNFGLSKATGDYIQFLDSDDILENTKFGESILLIEKEKCDIVITNFNMLENDKIKPPFSDITRREFTYKNLLLFWDIDFNFPPHSLLISSKIIKNKNFREDFKAKEDWIMWLDILRENPNIKFINKHLVLYRMHRNNMTKDSNHMSFYTDKAFHYILKNEDVFFEDFLNRIINEKIQKLEKYIHKINSRPWYKKIFYAIIGKK